MISSDLPYEIETVAGVVPGSSELRYDESKPHQVTFVFQQPCPEHGEGCPPSGHESVIWNVSRDLVIEGLDVESWIGEGIIHFRRASHDKIAMKLHGPDLKNTKGPVFSNTLLLPRRTLRDFLALTVTLVPAGTEGDSIDWDEFDAERSAWEETSE